MGIPNSNTNKISNNTNPTSQQKNDIDSTVLKNSTNLGKNTDYGLESDFTKKLEGMVSKGLNKSGNTSNVDNSNETENTTNHINITNNNYNTNSAQNNKKNNSNPQATQAWGEAPAVAQSDNSAQEEANAKAEEKRAKEQAEKERIAGLETAQKEKTQAALDKLKTNYEKERDKLKDVKHLSEMNWRFKLAGSPFIYSAITLINSGCALVPFVGPIVGFFTTMSIWFILSLLIGYIPLFSRMLIISVFDTIFGTTVQAFSAGTVNAIPGLPFFIDLIPEGLGYMFFKPKKIIENYAINTYIPKQLDHLEEEYQERREHIVSYGKDKLFNIAHRVKHHLNHMEGDHTKLFSFMFFMLIIGFGPLISFGPNLLTYTGTLPNFIIFGLFGIILLIATKIGMIKNNQFFTLAIFTGINAAIHPLIVYTTNMFSFLGSASVFGTILFFLFLVLFMFKNLEWIKSSSTIVIILLGVLLVSIIPYGTSYVSSGQYVQDIEAAQVKAVEGQADYANMNFMEKIEHFIENQQLRGSGKYVSSAQKMPTRQFMGLKITNINNKDKFRENQKITLKTTYQASSYETDMLLNYGCRADNIIGKVDEKVITFPAGESTKTVTCTFDKLKKGAHRIDIMGAYQFKSKLIIPFTTMNSDYVKILKDGNRELDIEKYIGGTLPSFTSAGPVEMGIGNVQGQNGKELKMPIILDPKKNEKFTFDMAIRPDLGENQIGEVEPNQIIMTIPTNLEIVETNFADMQQTTRKNFGNYYVLTIPSGAISGNYETLSFALKIKEGFNDKILPAHNYYKDIITVDVKYLIGFKQSTAIEVKA